MRVAKTMTLDLNLINKVALEAKETNRSFSQMVECILLSHYNKKDRPTSQS